MEAPDDWNSGKISATILSVDWKLNGLFATNFANKLFGSNEEAVSFFAIINAPSLANSAIPFVQKLGLISLALSQFVTINRESDLTLTDGSSAHLYSISVSVDQLRKLKVPLDKALDAVLITTQQHDKTYIVVYATELGRMNQYQSIFDNMLNSVTLGAASFSGTGAITSQSESQVPPTFNPTPQSTASNQPSPVNDVPTCPDSGVPGIARVINDSHYDEATGQMVLDFANP